MPNEAMEEALREAFATARSNIVILETLEIRHPAVAEPIYLVKNQESLTLTLEDDTERLFQACAFRMSLPTVSEDGLQELRIAIDNVNRQISDFVVLVMHSTIPVTLRYRPYLSTDYSKPQYDPPLELSLSDISVSTFEVVGRATLADIINKKFPNELYNRRRFPSLGN